MSPEPEIIDQIPVSLLIIVASSVVLN